MQELWQASRQCGGLTSDPSGKECGSSFIQDRNQKHRAVEKWRFNSGPQLSLIRSSAQRVRVNVLLSARCSHFGMKLDPRRSGAVSLWSAQWRPSVISGWKRLRSGWRTTRLWGRVCCDLWPTTCVVCLKLRNKQHGHYMWMLFLTILLREFFCRQVEWHHLFQSITCWLMSRC